MAANTCWLVLVLLVGLVWWPTAASVTALHSSTVLVSPHPSSACANRARQMIVLAVASRRPLCTPLCWLHRASRQGYQRARGI